MANEIAVAYITGKTLTADVFQPDGTERDFAVSLTETGQGCLYLGDCATITAGDYIVAYDSGTYIGGAEYLPDLSALDSRFDDIDSTLDTIYTDVHGIRNVYDERSGASGGTAGATSGVYPARC